MTTLQTLSLAEFPMPEQAMNRLPFRRWILEWSKKQCNGGVGAELGVYRGHFSELIAEVIAPRRLYLVDMWTSQGPHFPFKGPYSNFGKLTTALALQDTKARMSRFTNIEVLIKEMKTLDFLQTVGEKLDFVYLDSSHNYESTRRELDAVHDVMAPDGLILGDDWSIDPAHAHHGVFRAVQAFVREKPWDIVAAGHGGQFMLRRSQAATENMAT